MHVMMEYLGAEDKELIQMQKCCKRMYDVIIPTFKGSIKMPKKLITVQKVVLQSSKIGINFDVKEKEMKWILEGFLVRMIKEDYYDVVYQGIQYHFKNKLNWGPAPTDHRNITRIKLKWTDLDIETFTGLY